METAAPAPVEEKKRKKTADVETAAAEVTAEIESGMAAGAVSYTHLDVYKRQL